MPNGVICAGAVEGSNQEGAIVTCHAMTARPAGAGPSAAEAAPAETRLPTNRESMNAKPQRRPCNRVMRPSPLSRGTAAPGSGDTGSAIVSQPALLGNKLRGGAGAPHREAA